MLNPNSMTKQEKKDMMTWKEPISLWTNHDKLTHFKFLQHTGFIKLTPGQSVSL